MHPVDLAATRIPVLLNDFFRQKHRNEKARLTVFLCGRKPDDPHFDLRKQVKRLLESRMGCKAFLGEDIEELKYGPRPDSNHLTIEVKEATQSDLVVMFLGSAGTISEVTAFAMDEAINPKVVVFNDIKYRDDKSFVNLGPLKLLSKDQIIHYNVTDETPSEELVRHLDKIVAHKHFARAKAGEAFSPTLSFEDWTALCLIFVSYPVRYKALLELFPWGEPRLREGLKTLFAMNCIEERESKYVPSSDLGDWPINSTLVSNLSRARMVLFGKRLRDPDAVADYRLLV